jgi:hypothetical protein
VPGCGRQDHSLREVKDRLLTLSDLEGTIRKSRKRAIRAVFLTSSGVTQKDRVEVEERVRTAFTSGQNLYVFDLLDFARGVLALGGEPIRATFLRKVGEHLDKWNTQPGNRQDWKRLLERC